MAVEAPAFLNAPELAATLNDPAFAIAVIGVGMFATTENPRAAIAVYKTGDGSTSRPFMSFEDGATDPTHDGAERALLYTTDGDIIRRDAALVAHTHADGPVRNQAPTSNDLSEFVWQNDLHPGLTKAIIVPHRGIGAVTFTLLRAREDSGFKIDGRHISDLRETSPPDDIFHTMHQAGIISMSTTADVADSRLFDVSNMVRTYYR